MRYIKYKLILRRRENIMHGNLCLHHTEIWTKVTADFSQPVKQCLSDFRSKFLQLLHRQFFYIFRSVNCLNNFIICHLHSPYLFSLDFFNE